MADKKAAFRESVTMGVDAAKAKKEITVAVWEVWLCEEPEAEGAKPVKIRKLHEACGPTAKMACEEFVKIWTPDSTVQTPPKCPADGRTPKPDLRPEVQPCLL